MWGRVWIREVEWGINRRTEGHSNSISQPKKTADFYLKRSRFMFKPERFYRISATSVVDSESN
jgi:hypothetical protein